ncbi:hypothetical protein PHLGIDRAFT_115813 [Phlebiopsis gigantea 11061_1 CR5-6]|uniref:Cytochrome c oxidase-assembly factor COX23, mitochondrial n=1 Tax=Phlebiopsis gigantea (strain 11061_1 CR5-6) TaxID=745531 RepID=A0A0C3SBF8_PHLG1|nr:hypothetical protein PHLGIDRAFT_115813 [Phlebiopsis gigantea 11061_1 CR5-6]
MAKLTEDELPNPLDNVTPKPYKEVFKNRPETKFVDPCADASKASMACLNKNNFDKEKCTAYFQAYRDCKRAWLEQRKADRKAAS